MTVSVAAAQAQVQSRVRTETVQPRVVYVSALAFWLLTRVLVLVHQGAWPWMNSFVVAAARGIIVGDWNEAVRPQLPALLGVPLALLRLNDQQMVAALYLLASLAQFGALLVLLRAVFPGRLDAQSIALVVFLLIPFNHSIHHYRDMPVVLASAGIFLIGAHFVAHMRTGFHFGIREVVYVTALMVLGIWSRIEVIAFVGVLAVLGVLVYRRAALLLGITYAATALLVSGTLWEMYQLENVDLPQAWFYTAHTFLDSTPDSWLTPACRANPTENCREADGLSYFGPANLREGVFALAMKHPLTTMEKSIRSAWDNSWVLVGPNLSTFPGTIPFLVVVVALLPEVRQAYRQIGKPVWLIMLAIAAESVVPPLTWAPPHPQYHVALVLPMVLLLVPPLLVLLRMPRGRWLAYAYLLADAGLSVFRYTRYPGY